MVGEETQVKQSEKEPPGLQLLSSIVDTVFYELTLFIYLNQSLDLSISLSTVYLSIHLSVYLSMYLSMHVCIYVSVCLSFLLSYVITWPQFPSLSFSQSLTPTFSLPLDPFLLHFPSEKSNPPRGIN